MALLLYLRKTVVNYTSFIDLHLYNIFSREVTFSCFIGICVNLLTNICIDFLNHELEITFTYSKQLTIFSYSFVYLRSEKHSKNDSILFQNKTKHNLDDETLMSYL